MEPLRFTVRSGVREYPVYIAEGLLARLPSLLQDANLTGRAFVVSSPVIWKLHGGVVSEVLPHAKPVLIPDGERFKQPQTVMRIYDALIRAEADRSATIIALGGGVVGDTAGFAAATFLRGVNLAQVPTTLLAQVDSAIGGKVGVNHPLGKNLIGAFYPPAFVAADPRVLATLPRREFRAGLYEVVKYGMIASRDLFMRLSEQLGALFSRNSELLVSLIADSCRIKGEVVSADEKESGLRRILNFGHTAGHALEAVTKYRRFRHGEAVGYGMLVAAEVAIARGVLPLEDRDALAATIAKMGPLPAVADLPVKEILEAIKRDKKMLRGKLHFVLPTRIGATTIVDDVTEKELERALRKVGLPV